MTDPTQQFIDNLITVIANAEDAESVTNEMVARVLEYISSQLKTVSARLTEATQSVTTNTNRLNTILGNNATTAIDNLNEIIDFLQGFENDDTLAARLMELKKAFTMVRCEDEDDMEAKAASDTYPEGKLFFTPETD